MLLAFYCCRSLKSFPDISKWDTSNINNMTKIFNGCESLTSLPDISNWNTNNVQKMRGMFKDCYSLISLPDISKWNIDNVNNILKELGVHPKRLIFIFFRLFTQKIFFFKVNLNLYFYIFLSMNYKGLEK